MKFIQTGAARWPTDQLVLVLDNASHHKSAVLPHSVEPQDERISLFYRPTDSPQLNLIERIWRWLKGKLACHRLWNDLDGLQALVDRVLTHTVATFAESTYPHLKMSQDV